MITERWRRGENDGVFFNLPSCSSQLIPQQLLFAYNAIQNIFQFTLNKMGKAISSKPIAHFKKKLFLHVVYSVHHTLN